MNDLPHDSQSLSTHRTSEHGQQETFTTIELPLRSQRTCPCCSAVLLYHVRLSGLYWRCSYCGQEI